MIKPLVSLVIPAYNSEHWIESTLETVIAQSYSHEKLDVIVVDDGSTDRTIAVTEEMLRKGNIPFRILRQVNQGPGGMRNWGWRAGRGDWIQFLDADDLLHPRKIELQIEQVLALPPTVALVYSDWITFESGTRLHHISDQIRQPRIGNDPVADLLLTENFISTGSQLFRRTWLEQVGGFDNRYRMIEDVDLLLRIAMQGGGFLHIPSDDPLFYYRQNTNSLSRRDARQFVDGCLRNAALAEAFWRELNALTPVRANVLAQCYFFGSRFYAAVCPVRFEELTQKLDKLTGRFIPSAPRPLRLVSQVIGYRAAETIAVCYRKFKSRLRRSCAV